MTTKMKTNEQHFHDTVLCTCTCTNKAVLTLNMWMKPLCVTIKMKVVEQHFHVVLLIMRYMVVNMFTKQFVEG